MRLETGRPGKLIGFNIKKIISSMLMAEILCPAYKCQVVEEARDAYCQFADDSRTSAIYYTTISASGQR